MTRCSIVIPYYANPVMLERQYQTFAGYPAGVRDKLELIVVDDGSPRVPAHDVPRPPCGEIRVLRIRQDIPWNQHGARNLGAHVAVSPWLLMIDIDHVLTAENAERLLELETGDSRTVYRFARVRVGAADETRRKDPDREAARLRVKPHVNSFLVKRDLYWASGGYDEDYCGCLCGDGEFLRRLRRLGDFVEVDSPQLEVHTRHSVPDANTTLLPRGEDQQRECRRRIADKHRRNDTVPRNPLRFSWERVA